MKWWQKLINTYHTLICWLNTHFKIEIARHDQYVSQRICRYCGKRWLVIDWWGVQELDWTNETDERIKQYLEAEKRTSE